MHKKKFYFIVFEGVEGTGKSFQINRLYKYLKKKKLDVVKTREPGGSATAEQIRNLIFSKKTNQFDKLTDFYLMCAARNEHIKKFLLKEKKKKQIYIIKNLKPNLTIILKSNFKSIFSRIKKRKKLNKFDKLKINFYKKVQNFYLSIANNNKNYFVFDSSKNTPDLEIKIFNLIIKKLN